MGQKRFEVKSFEKFYNICYTGGSSVDPPPPKLYNLKVKLLLTEQIANTPELSSGPNVGIFPFLRNLLRMETSD